MNQWLENFKRTWWVDLMGLTCVALLAVGTWVAAVEPMLESRARREASQAKYAHQRREATVLKARLARVQRGVVEAEQALKDNRIRLQPADQVASYEPTRTTDQCPSHWILLYVEIASASMVQAHPERRPPDAEIRLLAKRLNGLLEVAGGVEECGGGLVPLHDDVPRRQAGDDGDRDARHELALVLDQDGDYELAEGLHADRAHRSEGSLEDVDL